MGFKHPPGPSGSGGSGSTSGSCPDRSTRLTTALYVRTSHRAPDQHPETQVCELEKFAARDGELRLSKRYVLVDEGWRRGQEEFRPGMNRLRRLVTRGRIRAVLFADVKRFARDVDFALKVYKELRSLGVHLISVRDHPTIDTRKTVPRAEGEEPEVMAKLMELRFTEAALRAAMESVEQGHEIAAGFERKRKENRAAGLPDSHGIGRPKALDEERGNRLVELRQVGHTWTEVAAELGVNARTCQRAYRVIKGK